MSLFRTENVSRTPFHVGLRKIIIGAFWYRGSLCEVCGLSKSQKSWSNHCGRLVVEILILTYSFYSPHMCVPQDDDTHTHRPMRSLHASFEMNCGGFDMLIARVYFSLVAFPSFHTNSRGLHSFDTCWISAYVYLWMFSLRSAVLY